jgi:tetratricopeptide (TPR) repeat protein
MKQLLLNACLFCFFISAYSQSRDSLDLLMLKGEYNKVIEGLDQKNGLDRTEISYLAFALRKTGSVNKAANVLTEYITSNGFNTDLGLQLADICYEAGYLDQSLKYYELVIQSDSSITRTYLQLANLYLTFDKVYSAINLLKFAHQQDTLNIQYMMRLSDAFIAAKRIRNADEILRKAYSFDPENLKVQRDLIKINYNLKNLAYVQEICQKGMNRYPNDYFFYYYDGMTFYKGGDFESAAYFLAKAKKLNSNDDNIKKYLGIAYYKTEQYDKSIDLLKRYISNDGHAPDVDFFLGCALSYTGDNVLALPYLQKALDMLTPENKVIAELHLQMGISNRVLKLYEVAEKNFKNALEADSAQAVLALFYLGSMYEYDINEKKQAKAYYEQFVHYVEKSDKKISEANNTYLGVAKRRITAITEELFFLEGVKNE